MKLGLEFGHGSYSVRDEIHRNQGPVDIQTFRRGGDGVGVPREVLSGPFELQVNLKP